MSERWLVALLAVALLWPAPRLLSIRPPNELVRLYSARAIVDDGTTAIDGPMRRHGRVMDRAERDGRTYSDKAPGLSLLAVPIYGALRMVWDANQLHDAVLLRLLQLLLLGIPSLVWLVLLRRWLVDVGIDAAIATAATIAYGLGSPAYGYATRFVGHQAAAWMIGIALLAAWRSREAHSTRVGLAYAALAGGLGAFAGITEYPTLPMLAVVAALTLSRGSARLPRLAAGIAGTLLPLAAAAIYHHVSFGSPFTTGYSFVTNPTFKAVHETGLIGVGLPKLDAIWALSIGRQRGLLILAPWVVVAGAAWLDRDTRRRPLWIAATVHLALSAWVATGFGYWLGGWSVGPRHAVSALPSLALLCAAGWQALQVHAPRTTPWLAGLAMAGVVAGSATTLTYPGFPPELFDPLFEMALPLLARGQFSFSVGTSLGLPANWAMLPALLAVVALLVTLSVLGSTPPGPRGSARVWWRAGTAAWVALVFFIVLGATSPQPEPKAIFRMAWLSQVKWQPAFEGAADTRLAGWEAAERTVRDNRRLSSDHARSLGAVRAYRGEAVTALQHYARAAWGQARPKGPAPDTPPTTPRDEE